MKLRLLSNYAGPSGSGYIGDIIEVNEDEGHELLAGRFAVSAETPVVESAVAPVNGAVNTSIS